MYQELEMYKTYKKEKQIKHNHEKFASISAIVFFAVIAIVINCLVWEVAEYLLTKYIKQTKYILLQCKYEQVWII